ncbi:MAG: hypothetical protein Q9195_007577 [Heterodermia aff. obscurata]
MPAAKNTMKTMEATTAVKVAFLLQPLATVVVVIAIAAGAMIKRGLKWLLPSYALNLASIAVTGFLDGWYNHVSDVDDGCTSQLGKLPPEIRIKIFKLAMQATGGIVFMPCLTDRSFKPNIAVGLLRTCRDIYHEAREYLYTENIIWFDTFASELRQIGKPIGLTRCHLIGCGAALNEPYFRHIHLEIGHESDFQGAFMTEAMQHSLSGMKSTLHVEKLAIKLRPHSLDSINMKLFLEALQKIQISHSLIIYGDASKYNELNLRAFAMAMGMNPGNHWVLPKPNAGQIDGPCFEMGFYASKK